MFNLRIFNSNNAINLMLSGTTLKNNFEAQIKLSIVNLSFSFIVLKC